MAVFAHEAPIDVGAEVPFGEHVLFGHGGVQPLVEGGGVESEHDAGEHRDESGVGVVGESLVAAQAREGRSGVVVETEVENGVHHAGHGELGAGPHRDQERIASVAEATAHALFEACDRRGDLGIEAAGPSLVHEGATRRRGDGEAGRHGETQTGHLREIGTLAPEEGAKMHGFDVVRVVEVEDERLGVSTRRRRANVSLRHCRFLSSGDGTDTSGQTFGQPVTFVLKTKIVFTPLRRPRGPRRQTDGGDDCGRIRRSPPV